MKMNISDVRLCSSHRQCDQSIAIFHRVVAVGVCLAIVTIYLPLLGAFLYYINTKPWLWIVSKFWHNVTCPIHYLNTKLSLAKCTISIQLQVGHFSVLVFFPPILPQLIKLINVVFTWHIMPFRFKSIFCYCSDFSLSCCYPPSSHAFVSVHFRLECICKFVSMLGGSFHSLDFCMPSMFMLSYFVVYFPKSKLDATHLSKTYITDYAA